jgi:cytochrome c biogenesis factor
MKIILAWNLICLGLLLNVVITGVLSSPLPFQQFNFDKPNIGMPYFPYVFIPGVVVQLVFFSHLTEIRRLWK